MLDLLEKAALTAVLNEAHRLLASSGLLCVVAMSEGRSRWARIPYGAWKAAYRCSPWLVGGCRPVRVEAFLDPAAWRVTHREVASSWGIGSEVLIAARV